MDTSGLEDEYQLSEGKPRLIYMCGQCSRYVVISVIYHELSSGVRPPAREKESSLEGLRNRGPDFVAGNQNISG